MVRTVPSTEARRSGEVSPASSVFSYRQTSRPVPASKATTRDEVSGSVPGPISPTSSTPGTHTSGTTTRSGWNNAPTRHPCSWPDHEYTPTERRTATPPRCSPGHSPPGPCCQAAPAPQRSTTAPPATRLSHPHSCLSPPLSGGTRGRGGSRRWPRPAPASCPRPPETLLTEGHHHGPPVRRHPRSHHTTGTPEPPQLLTRPPVHGNHPVVQGRHHPGHSPIDPVEPSTLRRLPGPPHPAHRPRHDQLLLKRRSSGVLGAPPQPHHRSQSRDRHDRRTYQRRHPSRTATARHHPRLLSAAGNRHRTRTEHRPQDHGRRHTHSASVA